MMTAQVSELHEAICERLTIRIAPPSDNRFHSSSSCVNRSWDLFSLALCVLQDLAKQTEGETDHPLWPN